MNTKIRRRTWIVTLPMVGLAAAYAYFFYLPGQRAITQLSEEVAAAEAFVDQARDLAVIVEPTRQHLNKTRQYNEVWEKAAPSGVGLFTLLGEINRLCKESGATATQFDPEEAVRRQRVQRIPLLLGYSGSFSQICKFLNALEQLPQTVWIENLRIEQSGQDGANVHCELSLAIFADNLDDSDQVDHSE